MAMEDCVVNLFRQMVGEKNYKLLKEIKRTLGPGKYFQPE